MRAATVSVWVFIAGVSVVRAGDMQVEQRQEQRRPWEHSSDLSHSINKLSSELAQTRAADLRMVDKLSRSLSPCDDEIQALREEIQQLKLDMAEVKSSVMKSNASEVVYFNAYSSKSTHCFDCVILYEGEFADSHNAMDITSGTFKCPLKGHYLLQFHSIAEKGHEIQLWIMVNDVDVIALTDWDVASNNQRMAVISQSLIFHLNEGDRVHVQLHRGKLKGHQGPVYTSFLGFMVGQRGAKVGYNEL